jgi:hypothetical protein
MTEEQNRLQYESFVTSAIHSGQLDAIVGYKEWLETTPLKDNSVLRLSTKDAEKFVGLMENPPAPTEELRRLLRDTK